MRFVNTVVRALALILLCAAGSAALAQDWPARKPIRIISAFPAGGTTDILARVLAQKLAEPLGQSVVVENKAGAGGIIGTDAVAKAAPDGYTFLLGNSGALASGLSLYPNAPYDPTKDLASIAIVGDVTIVLAVNPQVPAQSLKELLDLARAKPGQLSVGIPSVGSIHHLLIEQMMKEAGVKLIKVPYKGSAPAVTDLIGGVIHIDLDNLPAMAQFIKAGRVRGIAVGSPTRPSFMPDVPTFAEAGMPSMMASPWFSLVAPAGTPAAIIERMNREVVAILKSADIREKFEAQGLNPRWSTPAEGDELIRTELTRWAKIVKETGAKLE
ncbi:MAG: tripartite tricarboxylate transporter substrate binding protein [Betaproteobacteria bacterium]|nr:tripartite tricarboxylate transporter substrate binding protein [Betaproteobacteria bacterium]